MLLFGLRVVFSGARVQVVHHLTLRSMPCTPLLSCVARWAFAVTDVNECANIPPKAILKQRECGGNGLSTVTYPEDYAPLPPLSVSRLRPILPHLGQIR